MIERHYTSYCFPLYIQISTPALVALARSEVVFKEIM